MKTFRLSIVTLFIALLSGASYAAQQTGEIKGTNAEPDCEYISVREIP
jgi:hypothetical protein